MRVIITGGTGLLGRPLAASLAADGHDVIVLSRNPEQTARRLQHGIRAERWDARTAQGWGHLADGADAIVNLAAHIIARPVPFLGRWTAAKKRMILESRLNSGAAVVDAVRAAQHKPRVVVQASGSGYYGLHGDEMVTEDDPHGDDFLAQVCVQWENATRPVADMGVRHVVARTGLPLTNRGGVFPVFKFQHAIFAGGPIGSGRQYYPWIHVEDEIRALRFLIESPAEGAYNLCAPNPATSRELSRALGKVMGRPSLIPTPGFALKIAYGELADLLLLGGQRMVPQCLQQAGFEFKFPALEPALRDLIKGPGRAK